MLGLGQSIFEEGMKKGRGEVNALKIIKFHFAGLVNADIARKLFIKEELHLKIYVN